MVSYQVVVGGLAGEAVLALVAVADKLVVAAAERRLVDAANIIEHAHRRWLGGAIGVGVVQLHRRLRARCRLAVGAARVAVALCVCVCVRTQGKK